jgi:hypothetical protein
MDEPYAIPRTLRTPTASVRSTGSPGHRREEEIELTANTENHPDRRHVETSRVGQIAVPPAAGECSTLSRVDYEDAFLVDVGPHADRTAEQWARAVIEDAPAATRHGLSRGWFALGLRLGSTRSDRFVLGWEVRSSTPDTALLGASGRLGLSGELLFERQRNSLLFATFLQLDNPIARAVWAGIAAGHRRTVQHLLEQASAER